MPIFEGYMPLLNNTIMDVFGVNMTIGGKDVVAKFMRPMDDMPSLDGKKPTPKIDIKDADIADIDTSSGVRVLVDTEQYVITSREPGFRGRTVINLRRAV